MEVRSLTNGIVDTTTAHGALVFGVFALMAEYEAALIRERTQAGLATARARGPARRAQTQDDPRPNRQGRADVRRSSIHHGRNLASCGVTPMTVYRNIHTTPSAALPKPGSNGELGLGSCALIILRPVCEGSGFLPGFRAAG
jgi:hypothetical protein